MSRCAKCGNRVEYCTCIPSNRPKPVLKTDYESLVETTLLNLRVVGYEFTPSPTELMMTKLGYDPSQDGLYLCEKGCGITWDHECDYGGWHTTEQALTVSLLPESEPT